ncbi:MAG: ThuA domain-containing protein [bacterium]
MKKLTTIQILVVGLLNATAYAASPVPAIPDDNAPTQFCAVPPKGHIILWGADAAKSGSPMTYQISYLADEAVAGKPMQISVHTTTPVEMEKVNAKTGLKEKIKTQNHGWKIISITLKKQSVESITLPPMDKETSVELFFTEENKENVARPRPLSNSIELKKKGNLFQLPEADEIAKTIAALPEKSPAPPASPRKVLVYTATAGFKHDSIPLGARTILLLGQKTGAWQTHISNDCFMFEPETLAQFDAVMMMETTGPLFGVADRATNERLRKSLLDFVQSGKGLAGSHAATDCAYDWKEYGDMIGAYFNGHPFGKITVRNEDPKSPINAAFKGEGFDFQDEMYTFKDPYSREKLRILLSIDIAKMADDPAKPGFKMKENRADHDYAISWIKEYGKGHVFYCSFGHQHNIWWTPTLLEHYLAGMQYALGDLKADAKPSASK